MAEKQAESYQLCCVCGAVQKSKPTKTFTVITAPGGGCREVAFVTITHDALDLIVHGPLAPPHLDRGPHWTGTNPASDILWPSLETCSNVFTSATLLI